MPSPESLELPSLTSGGTSERGLSPAGGPSGEIVRLSGRVTVPRSAFAVCWSEPASASEPS